MKLPLQHVFNGILCLCKCFNRESDKREILSKYVSRFCTYREKKKIGSLTFSDNCYNIRCSVLSFCLRVERKEYDPF